MNVLNFLAHLQPFVTIAANCVILCFAFTAYRRTGLRAFMFWIAGCAVFLLSLIAMMTYGSAQNVPPENRRSFMIFSVGTYIIYNTCLAIGCVLLIRHVIDKLGAPTVGDNSPQSDSGNVASK
jgi:hypothetical protein